MRYESEIAGCAPVNKAVSAAKKGAYSHAYAIVVEDGYTAGVVSALLISAISGAEANRVFEGGYADVRFFPSDNRKVVSADVDEITSSAYLTPTELTNKFYVIRNASTMNESSQNKLLKTLEEAPPSVVIILEIESEAAILPTVMSRCNRVDVPPIENEQLKKALTEYCGDGDVELAASLSGGYPGKAEKILADADYEADFSLAMETLLFMKTSRNILTYSQKWAQRKDSLADIADCLALILEDCMSASEGLLTRVRLKSRLQDVKRLSSDYTSEAVAQIMPHVILAKQYVAQYCNAQAIIDGLLFKILEVKAKCRKS